MSRTIAALLILVIAGIVLVDYACTPGGEFTKLRWPPDTIRAVRAYGNVYEVTTSPAAADPKMNVVLIWPPDTTTRLRLMTTTGPWIPDTTNLESMKSSVRMLESTIWPPDTTMYPEQVLMIWPPDMT